MGCFVICTSVEEISLAQVVACCCAVMSCPLPPAPCHPALIPAHLSGVFWGKLTGARGLAIVMIGVISSGSVISAWRLEMFLAPGDSLISRTRPFFLTLQRANR